MDSKMEGPQTIHVEVCQKAESTLDVKELENLILHEIANYSGYSTLTDDELASQKNLAEHVESIVSSTSKDDKLDFRKVRERTLRFYIYRLTEESGATEVMQHDSEDLPAISQWILPAKEFHGLWQNLYFDSDIKKKLLSFVETAMLFSKYKVNPNIVSFNRVVLLHGPPGTGKTSLCKALAQKISIRFGEEYSHGELIEINSHSLFSKWFSESGKLVMKLFSDIKERLERPEVLVCILIDEVESLAHVRKACQAGIEPTDSIRVVNALLTQLDQIKRYPNVLILTTSNLTEAVDLAFTDRADIKQYIGHIKYPNIYRIYKSCLEELMRVNFIPAQELLSFMQLSGHIQFGLLDENCVEISETANSPGEYSIALLGLSKLSEGLSGRSLRKIPFLTYASCLRKSTNLQEFLKCMQGIIAEQKTLDEEEPLPSV